MDRETRRRIAVDAQHSDSLADSTTPSPQSVYATSFASGVTVGFVAATFAGLAGAIISADQKILTALFVGATDLFVTFLKRRAK